MKFKKKMSFPPNLFDFYKRMLEIISLHTLSISFHEIKYQIFYFMEKKNQKFQKKIMKKI